MGRKKKTEEVTEEVTEEAVDGKTRHSGNISMDILLTMADGSTHESNITIRNPRGCIPASQLVNPDYVMGVIKKEVSERFGTAHVR